MNKFGIVVLFLILISSIVFSASAIDTTIINKAAKNLGFEITVNPIDDVAYVKEAFTKLGMPKTAINAVNTSNAANLRVKLSSVYIVTENTFFYTSPTDKLNTFKFNTTIDKVQQVGKNWKIDITKFPAPPVPEPIVPDPVAPKPVDPVNPASAGSATANSTSSATGGAGGTGTGGSANATVNVEGPAAQPATPRETIINNKNVNLIRIYNGTSAGASGVGVGTGGTGIVNPNPVSTMGTTTSTTYSPDFVIPEPNLVVVPPEPVIPPVPKPTVIDPVPPVIPTPDPVPPVVPKPVPPVVPKPWSIFTPQFKTFLTNGFGALLIVQVGLELINLGKMAYLIEDRANSLLGPNIEFFKSFAIHTSADANEVWAIPATYTQYDTFNIKMIGNEDGSIIPSAYWPEVIVVQPNTTFNMNFEKDMLLALDSAPGWSGIATTLTSSLTMTGVIESDISGKDPPVVYYVDYEVYDLSTKKSVYQQYCWPKGVAAQDNATIENMIKNVAWNPTKGSGDTKVFECNLSGLKNILSNGKDYAIAVFVRFNPAIATIAHNDVQNKLDYSKCSFIRRLDKFSKMNYCDEIYTPLFTTSTKELKPEIKTVADDFRKNVIENAGWWEGFWSGFKNYFKGLWESTKDIFTGNDSDAKAWASIGFGKGQVMSRVSAFSKTLLGVASYPLLGVQSALSSLSSESARLKVIGEFNSFMSQKLAVGVATEGYPIIQAFTYNGSGAALGNYEKGYFIGQFQEDFSSKLAARKYDLSSSWSIEKYIDPVIVKHSFLIDGKLVASNDSSAIDDLSAFIKHPFESNKWVIVVNNLPYKATKETKVSWVADFVTKNKQGTGGFTIGVNDKDIQPGVCRKDSVIVFDSTIDNWTCKSTLQNIVIKSSGTGACTNASASSTSPVPMAKCTQSSELAAANATIESANTQIAKLKQENSALESDLWDALDYYDELDATTADLASQVKVKTEEAKDAVKRATEAEKAQAELESELEGMVGVEDELAPAKELTKTTATFRDAALKAVADLIAKAKSKDSSSTAVSAGKVLDEAVAGYIGQGVNNDFTIENKEDLVRLSLNNLELGCAVPESSYKGVCASTTDSTLSDNVIELPETQKISTQQQTAILNAINNLAPTSVNNLSGVQLVWEDESNIIYKKMVFMKNLAGDFVIVEPTIMNYGIEPKNPKFTVQTNSVPLENQLSSLGTNLTFIPPTLVEGTKDLVFSTAWILVDGEQVVALVADIHPNSRPYTKVAVLVTNGNAYGFDGAKWVKIIR